VKPVVRKAEEGATPRSLEWLKQQVDGNRRFEN
jgi:hypothetical protein